MGGIPRQIGAAAFIAVMAVATGWPALAKADDRTMLSRLPERFGPDLSSRSYADQQQALASAVSDYLSGGYCIADLRSIALPARNLQWAAIGKAAGGDIETLLGGYRVIPDGYNPGYDLIVTWAVRDNPGALIALAALENPVQGGPHLLSYFELRKAPDTAAAARPCDAEQGEMPATQALPRLIDLPPPDGRVFTPRAADRMRMIDVLNSRLEGRFRIVAERYFDTQERLAGFAVTGRTGAFLKRRYGASFEAAIGDARSSDSVSATLWCPSAKSLPCFAVAVLESIGDAHNDLIGYFEIIRDNGN